jgi:hypothetical protein
VLKEVLQRLSDLCPGRPDTIRLEDWKALKDLASLSVLDVEQLFYPGAPPELLYQILADETQGRPYRSAKFLTTLTDAEYYTAYNYVQGSPEGAETAQRFPDVEAILSRGRKEGPILSQVMSQVVQWINPEPMAIAPRQPDKPQHWRDFIPAFAGIPYEDAEHAARELQRNIFNLVRGRFEELDQVWEGNVTHPTYTTRFQSTIWHELLVLVHATVGPRFVGQMERVNKGPPPPSSSNSKPALVHRVREAICRLPEVSRNPALRDPAATKELMDRLSPLVAKWVIEWCDRGLTAQADPRTRPWRPSDLELVRADRLAMSALVQVNAHPEDRRSPRRTTDGVQSRVSPPESPLDPSSVVSLTQSPVRPLTSQPVGASEPLSGLLNPNAEAFGAMRKAFRGRLDQQARTPLPSAGVLSRAPLATPDRIRSPATTAATRPKLPWASGPATQPDYR